MTYLSLCRMGCVDTPSTRRRSNLQDIESIELELEKLRADFLDAVPTVGPVLGRRADEHRDAVRGDSRPSQHRLVDERRTLAPNPDVTTMTARRCSRVRRPPI